MCAADHRLTLDDILTVEDDDAFASVACPDTEILVWPAVRNEFLRLIIGDLLYPTAPLVDLAPTHRRTKVIAGAARSAVHNLLHPASRSDVLIVGTGAGLIARGNRAFNRYTDYFAGELRNRAWTVESLHGGAWPTLRRANPRHGCLSDRRVLREVEARRKVRARHIALVRELVNVACQRGRDRLGWAIGDERRESLVSLGARRLATYPSEARFVSRLLNRVKPRLALVEEGCYGRMAVFNATAREAGVTVAEFQHGMISRGHDAYNVAPSLIASEPYKRSQPDDLLAYGSWWNGQVTAPLDRKVVIGNPHRAEVLRSWRATEERNVVLVIGDGVETNAYVALCRRLSKLLPEPFRIVFRPHPRERHKVRGTGSNDIAIDTQTDLYASLASASMIVAEASTVLFEAVGLADRVLVWDTDKSRFYLGDHPFTRFADAEEFAALIGPGGAGIPETIEAEQLWASGWRTRLMDYVEDRV